METIFLKILNMSLTATWVILVVFVARFCLKKAPRVFSYALWSVVFFRLSFPFSFSAIFSLIPSSTVLPNDILTSPTPSINTGFTAIDNAVSLPVPVIGNSVNPLQVVAYIAFLVWAIGFMAIVCINLFSVLKLHISLKNSAHLRDNIYTAQNLKTPFVLGIFKPKIYLPSDIIKGDFVPDYILLHEQIHIKRLDYILKPIAFLIVCVHWFNPFVWLSFFAFSQDMETSCDEAVIKKLGEDVKSDYSSSLLALASERKFITASPLAFGENNVKSRIKNILNYKKPAFWVVIFAVIAIVTVGIGLVANPKEKPFELGTPVKNKIMAQAKINDEYSLQLCLVNGHTFKGEDAGLSVFIHEDNFQGEYELRCLKNDKIVSTIDNETLSIIGFDEKSLNFDKEFAINLDDYNNDGNLDFAIGQPMSSSLNLFLLFSVDKNGKLFALPTNEPKGGFSASILEFSPKFTKTSENAFSYDVYNNSDGLTRQYIQTWNGKQFAQSRFITQEDFLDEISQSFNIIDGVASFVVPDALPAGYDIPQLSVNVSGFMPIEGDTNMSFHAFEELDEGKQWQLGKKYSEKLFAPNPPDKTEVSAWFYLYEKDLSQSKYFIGVNKVFPLRDDSFTPSVTTSLPGQNQTVVFRDKYNDTFTLDCTFPEGITLVPQKEGDEPTIERAVLIYKNNIHVGILFYNHFDSIKGEDNKATAIYQGLMLGSVQNWNNEYTVINTTENGSTATCVPIFPNFDNDLDPESNYHKGILSNDKTKEKYIAMAFSADSITDEEWLAIAKSIKLS